MSLLEASGRQVLALSGELDLAGARSVEEALVGIAGSTVVLDLEELTLIDAAGLSALVRAKQRIEARGHRMVVQNATGLVARVIALTGLEPYLLDEPGQPSPR